MQPSTDGDLTQYATTALGREAYQMLDWVFEDPSRAAEGQQRLAGMLTRAEGDQAATQELSDVGLILARLR